MFQESNIFRENMFSENMFRENMFRENMHPPRANVRSINIEIEYTCTLARQYGSSMTKEQSEKSKNSIVRGLNAGQARVIIGPAPYPLGPNWAIEILYGPAGRKALYRFRAATNIRSWKLVVPWGLIPRGLKTDPPVRASMVLCRIGSRAP
jgi:hypothetical protein